MSKRVENTVTGTLRLADGSQMKVIGQTNRYWLGENQQFRKNNPQIMGFTQNPKTPPRPQKTALRKKGTEEINAQTE